MSDKDYFVKDEEGLEEYAGKHMTVDLFGVKVPLDDINFIDGVLRNAVKAGGATLIKIDLHHFEPNGGVSGVAILAESHISVHTWPERKFAAFDVFMCGSAKTEEAIKSIMNEVEAEYNFTVLIKRGYIDNA